MRSVEQADVELVAHVRPADFADEFNHEAFAIGKAVVSTANDPCRWINQPSKNLTCSFSLI
jgi:hypothetical protein